MVNKEMAIDVVSTSLNSAPTATLAMSTLKVSIPPHLREILDPLVCLLPPELEELLIKSLDGTDIMYTTLVDISKWAFTEEGKQKLESKNLSKTQNDLFLPPNDFAPSRSFCYLPSISNRISPRSQTSETTIE
jgi:hypothetical protein